MRDVIAGVAIAALVALAGCAGQAETDGKAAGGGTKSSGQNGQNNQKVDITSRLKAGEPIPDVANTVHFDYDKSLLRSEDLPVLRGVADWMRHYPDVLILIAGHADERGTREYNLALGSQRATTVRNYLISLGIAEQRLSTVSYGKERPVVAGSNDESYAQNRRAVAEVQ
jgi:peptidoglycan-associated lipoprotein